MWEPDLSFNNSRQESDGSSGSRDAVAVQVIVCAVPRTSTAAEAESRKREDEGERDDRYTLSIVSKDEGLVLRSLCPFTADAHFA